MTLWHGGGERGTRTRHEAPDNGYPATDTDQPALAYLADPAVVTPLATIVAALVELGHIADAHGLDQATATRLVNAAVLDALDGHTP